MLLSSNFELHNYDHVVHEMSTRLAAAITTVPLYICVPVCLLAVKPLTALTSNVPYSLLLLGLKSQ